MDQIEGTMTENDTTAPFVSASLVDGRTEFGGDHPFNHLHSLPFSMDFTGPALVSKFFQTEQINGADGLKAAQFRGHLLLGKTVKAPDGFAFYTVKESEQSVDVKMYKVVDSVHSIDIWEYDEPPESRKNSFKNALVALQIASDLAA